MKEESRLGKSRNKNRSESESLKGEIRRLRKLLRQAEKHAASSEPEEDESPVKKKKSGVVICPECNEGEINLVLDLGFKLIYECNHCQFRKSERVNDESSD